MVRTESAGTQRDAAATLVRPDNIAQLAKHLGNPTAMEKARKPVRPPLRRWGTGRHPFEDRRDARERVGLVWSVERIAAEGR